MPFIGSQPAESALTTGDLGDNIVDGTKTKDALIGDYSDVTITASDLIMYGDATDSNNTKRDTVQGILDLASGGKLLQVVNTTTSANATGTADFGNDDTIPQNSEGTEFMTLAITPAATSNKLIIITNVQYTNSASARTYFALFQDSTANALGGAIIDNSGNDIFQNMSFQHYMTAGTTSATTFKIRGGTSGGTLRVNGNSGGRFWGGILSTSMTIMEID
jgi:hypothetical protein